MANRRVRSLVFLAALAAASISRAESKNVLPDARQTIEEYKSADPGTASLFQNSAGYAVFPNVGKGGFVVGAAAGDGILFEDGQPVGRATLNQVSFGAQIGGQVYAEVIFFDTPQAVARFKRDQLEFSAQTSAVALSSGASANLKYADGVAIMTNARAGFMAEATIGGQTFHYVPFKKPPVG